MSSTGGYIGALPCQGQSPAVNNPPTHEKPVLTASDAPKNSTDAYLHCQAVAVNDLDNDPVSIDYRWLRDSNVVSGLALENLSADMTQDNESWQCSVTPYDGKDSGTTLYSNIIRIIPSNTVVCGDNSCSSSENCTSCASDCGACIVITPQACGNNLCESSESCKTCPQDCKCPSIPKKGGGGGSSGSRGNGPGGYIVQIPKEDVIVNETKIIEPAESIPKTAENFTEIYTERIEDAKNLTLDQPMPVSNGTRGTAIILFLFAVLTFISVLLFNKLKSSRISL
jgi:hypothetical protein